ncbi:GNAT family N-acetyltransferase [Streptomyces rhizosphaericola]|uniref:GNAT family N-acetyltransferase n=1 Tax=Streptomyces rhizosphaericola TaxID=2564098 RepID=UPI003BF5AE83
MSGILLRLADLADKPTVERLWQMYQHDMSELEGDLPNPDGSFRDEWLHMAFSELDRAPYLLTSGDQPIGFAFVRGLIGPTRVMNSFFVVRGARRAGTGMHAAQCVVARHPGPWEIAFQDANPGAVKFWRRVATEIAGDTWTEERRAVPNRSELAPDVWISFNTTAGSSDVRPVDDGA